jgi:hypothetical protein
LLREITEEAIINLFTTEFTCRHRDNYEKLVSQNMQCLCVWFNQVVSKLKRDTQLSRGHPTWGQKQIQFLKCCSLRVQGDRQNTVTQ